MHPDEEAIAVCVNCHKPLCESCRVKFNDRNYCRECANNAKLKMVSSPIDNAATKFDDMLKEKGFHKEMEGLGKAMDKLVQKGYKQSASIPDKLKTFRNRSPNRTNSPLEEIKIAKELLDTGVISKEEFDEIKKKCLERV